MRTFFTRLLITSAMLAITNTLLFQTCVYAGASDVNITASRGTHEDAVILAWEPIPWATSYKIYRSDNHDGPYWPIGWIDDGSTPSFTDTEAERGHYYWYKVRPIYAWFVIGLPTEEVQGWIRPQMTGGMLGMLDFALDMIGQVGHIHDLRADARECETRLPLPMNIDHLIADDNTIYQWVEGACATPHRRIGSPEGHAGAVYVEDRLSDILGPESVYMDTVELDAVYTATNHKLEIETSGGVVDFPCFYTVNTGITYDNPTGGSAAGEMVWAGDGSVDEFNALGDITGKIVVANCPFLNAPLGLIKFIFNDFYYTSDPNNTLTLDSYYPFTFARTNFPAEYNEERFEESVYWLAHDRGAAGLVLVMKDHPADTDTHWGPYDGKIRPMPCLWVSSYKGAEIEAIVKSNATATITLDGTITPGEGYNVWGVLPGQSKETIVVSTHLDSPHKGATEDGTGIAMVLAQADAWSKVPFSLRKKTMLFVFADGHHYRGIGSETFAEEHMDLFENAIIDINLEHLASKSVIDEGGEFVYDNQLALNPVMVTENPVAIATAVRMMKNHHPERSAVVHSTLVGDVPPGEAGHYHIACGIDFIHWIGMPLYLLTAEDTLDKVDVDKLNSIAGMAAEMIGTYMTLPDGYSYY